MKDQRGQIEGGTTTEEETTTEMEGTIERIGVGIKTETTVRDKIVRWTRRTLTSTKEDRSKR